jgi:hypothetical protein
MRRSSTSDEQGPIDSSKLRSDTSRWHRAIRKHDGDLRHSIWTRRHDRTRTGRRGGGLRRKSRTDARRRYIRLAFRVSYSSTRLTRVLYIISISQSLERHYRGSRAEATPAPLSLSLYAPTLYLSSIGSLCDRLEASRVKYSSRPAPRA